MTSEPLLLVPGFMADARVFWHQIIALSAGRAVQVARPGAGATAEEMAEAVLADAPPRFALAGHWLGGVVAIEMLRRAPERITRIALLDVNPLAESPQTAAEREPRIVRGRTGRLAEAILQDIPETALAPGPGRAEVQAMILDMAEALGPDAYERQSRALMRRPDQQRMLRGARLPGLVLCGAQDTLCPVRRQELMAELMPAARFRPIAGAGHLPSLEQPEATTAALRDWLDAAPPR